MDLLTGEVIVGRTVADVLPNEVISEVQDDLLPTGEIILDRMTPDFSIARVGTRLAIFVDLEQQIKAGVLTVEPEGDAGVSAPVLVCPGVYSRILEGVGRPTPAGRIDLNLEEMIVPRLPWQGQRIAVGHLCSGDGNRCVGIAPSHKANTKAVAIQPCRQTILEIVYDGENRRRNLVIVLDGEERSAGAAQRYADGRRQGQVDRLRRLFIGIIRGGHREALGQVTGGEDQGAGGGGVVRPGSGRAVRRGVGHSDRVGAGHVQGNGNSHHFPFIDRVALGREADAE